MSPPEDRGYWSADCIQRAFVDGAQWWQFHKNGATAFPSERDEMEAEAVRKYGNPGCPCSNRAVGDYEGPLETCPIHGREGAEKGTKG